jgi:hypothetical protein
MRWRVLLLKCPPVQIAGDKRLARTTPKQRAQSPSGKGCYQQELPPVGCRFRLRYGEVVPDVSEFLVTSPAR